MRKKFIQSRRSHRPPLDEDLILFWADEHFKKFGAWPKQESGPIDGHDGETWGNVDSALRNGLRGLLLGSSLAILLHERRGVMNRLMKPILTVEEILLWADHHFAKYGVYPAKKDGTIEAAPHETWCGVDASLFRGCRGLPGRSSLPKLLQEHRGRHNEQCQPKLSITVILQWADEHHQRTGKWPTRNSGIVQASPGERWSAVSSALDEGLRGLPGEASLARILIQHRGKKDISDLPPITIETITEWLRMHASRHGKYPSCISGIIEDAPQETWASVSAALVTGGRGLPGGMSLAILKQNLINTGKLPELTDTPPYDIETITTWLRSHALRHGKYPTLESGAIDEAPEVAWCRVDGALRCGHHGFPGGSSLAKFKQNLINEGKLPKLDQQEYSIDTITIWLRSHVERHGQYPTLESGAIDDAPKETWGIVNSALATGYRGLPGGLSLAKLKQKLIQEGKLPNVRRI